MPKMLTVNLIDGLLTIKCCITIADVLAVFPGAKVVEIYSGCSAIAHQSGRRVGKPVEAIYPDGRKKWICHYCGREILFPKQGLYESTNT